MQRYLFIYAIIGALVLTSLSLSFVFDAYATHVSRPIIDMDRQLFKIHETIAVKGWVDYNNKPTSNVLLDITLRAPNGNEIVREKTRSNMDGNFIWNITLPVNSLPGNYTIEVISQCTDEHRNICKYKRSSIPIVIQTPPIIIKITSPGTGKQVPVGEFTISGISTDNAATDCTVYADWNDQKPFQIATATGPGGVHDYSNWTFTYTDKYHLIVNGTNNLTSKLSCFIDNGNGTVNLTKFYSVNVIGATTTPTNNSTGPTSKEVQ
jgi:hypothetical protein